MRAMRLWVVAVAVAGFVSSAAAAGLLWLLFTQPVRLTQLIARAF